MTSTTTAGRPASRAPAAAVLAMAFRSVGVLAVLSVPVASGLAAPGAGMPAERDHEQSPVWRSAYSERFPGCVPTVLWPADERPVAVLTKGPDGRVHRVAVETYRRGAGIEPGARTIGVCR